MRRFGLLLAAGLCHAPGCSSTCVDDGAVFNQSLEACMTAGLTANATEGTATEGSESDTDGQTMTAPTEGSATEGSATEGSNSNSESNSNSNSNSESDTITGGGGGVWCEDKDGDGFGDPANCVPQEPGEDPPAGFVPNDDDCADDDANTFPGAAENEDPPDACMQDLDGDGWGDSTPDDPDVTPGTDCDDGSEHTFPGAAPNDDAMACMTDVDGDDWGESMPMNPDVTPGTDCDDDDASTFPGSAEVEDPEKCMKDEDGDGWGDSSVDPGVDVGADCYDSNADINPGDRVLYTAFDDGQFAEIDVETGDVTPFAGVDLGPLAPPYAVITCAISPTDGAIYCSQSAKQILIVVDYCSGDAPTELADHGRSICGLGFLDDGTLYGIDSDADELVTFDPATGEVTDAKPLTLDGDGVNIQACGMAVDCVGERMLVTDGQNSRILSVDPNTGEGTVVADIPEGQWNSVGLEFDSVSKQAFSNNGDELYQITLDGSNDYMQLPDLSVSINDLSYGPTCN
ncbi:hypothetical protein SAMN02745121_07366 [Nannocystis exedens]|uniref:Thrombospondin type 3 repeat-containing protein n=1 Tax=Nannocystis exedens TaxID=54 RepID=A0A1I2GM49_9BACT|nr:SMP-30/gluconolactonase/LRE family protein [Nannocystis exedens]PCC73617.1 hypothetical protein NAEX_06705 [Nannocystis exedens]SFF17927.1 hypothetical protein SAMN02745121_07366 [Nannocystis exedens]